MVELVLGLFKKTKRKTSSATAGFFNCSFATILYLEGGVPMCIEEQRREAREAEKVFAVLAHLIETGEIRMYLCKGLISTTADSHSPGNGLLIDPKTYFDLLELYDELGFAELSENASMG